MSAAKIKGSSFASGRFSEHTMTMAFPLSGPSIDTICSPSGKRWTSSRCMGDSICAASERASVSLPGNA